MGRATACGALEGQAVGSSVEALLVQGRLFRCRDKVSLGGVGAVLVYEEIKLL